MTPTRGLVVALVSALMTLAPAAGAAPIDVARLIDPQPKAAVPGCVAGAFRRGEVIAEGASGAADLSKGEALTPRTRLYAGSVSKQFTALALAKLVEAGRLSLDDEVQTYVPEVPRYASKVTLRMLMHHVSGVRDSLDLLALAGVETRRTPMQDALQLLYLQKRPNFTPGTRYSYSNGGYLLLAEVIERASGMPFQDYVRQTILDPLGMSHSFFLATLPAPGIMAHGYVPSAEGFVVRDTYPDFGGSGGLVTTLDDMAKYDRDVVVSRKVFTPAVEKILTEAGRFNDGTIVTPPGTEEAYAGGVMIGQHRGLKVIEHGGAAEGFLAHFIRIPDRGLEVVVLCNRGDVRPDAIADRLIEAVEGPILAPLPPRSPVRRAPPPSGPLAPGRYVSDELAATWQVDVRDGVITAVVSSDWPTRKRPAPTFKFIRTGSGGFSADGVALVADADGEGFTLDTGRSSGIVFKRAP
jgi:CubicO group peptidase (beta-lactamase class C family)